jgi:hypothetical protein
MWMFLDHFSCNIIDLHSDLILGRKVAPMMTKQHPSQSDAQNQTPSTTEYAAQPQTSYELASKKRSFDYILKSGLAGGLAGCAVSISL